MNVEADFVIGLSLIGFLFGVSLTFWLASFSAAKNKDEMLFYRREVARLMNEMEIIKQQLMDQMEREYGDDGDGDGWKHV